MQVGYVRLKRGEVAYPGSRGLEEGRAGTLTIPPGLPVTAASMGVAPASLKVLPRPSSHSICTTAEEVGSSDYP